VATIITTLIVMLGINALILILLVAFNTEALRRVKNIIDILSNGAFTSCPFYRDLMTHDRRELEKIFLSKKKGGEEL